MGDVSGQAPITRRGYLIRVGVVLGTTPVALLVACSPSAATPTVAPAKPAEAKATEAPKPAATAAPAGKGTVTIDWWVPNFHAAGAKPLKEKFEGVYPNIKLNQIETVSQGLLEKVLTTLKGST